MTAEAVIEEFSSWAKSLPSKGFKEAAAFGSVLEAGATPFLGSISDLDAVLVFAGERGSPYTRTKTLESFVSYKESLENRLRKRLERADATERIASLLVVTDDECRWDISKAYCATFFSTNCGTTFRSGVTDEVIVFDVRCPAKLWPHLSVNDFAQAIIHVQKARHEFVAVNGNGKAILEAFDDPIDVVPKDVMRWASVVAFHTPDRPPLRNADKYDLNSGLQSLQQWLAQFARNDAHYCDLMQIVSTRAGRGRTNTPLTPRDQLLLWEIVFEKAIASLEAVLASELESPNAQDILDRLWLSKDAVELMGKKQLPYSRLCTSCHNNTQAGITGSHDYLCKNCRQQASTEKWGPETDLLYRRIGVILQGITFSAETGIFTCRIPVDIADIEDEDVVSVLVTEVARILKCPRECIMLQHLEAGSTLVSMTLPIEVLNRALVLKSDRESWNDAMESIASKIKRRMVLNFLWKELRERIKFDEELDNEELQKIIDMAKEAAGICRDFDLTDKLISIECNLGSLYEKVGDLAEAESHHRTALSMEEVNEYPVGIALHSYNLGRVLYLGRRYTDARPYLERARDLYKELRDAEMEGHAQRLLDRIS